MDSSFRLISSQSLNLAGHQGNTDDVATVTLHLSLSSATLMESPNSIPVHSLMLYIFPSLHLSIVFSFFWLASLFLQVSLSVVTKIKDLRSNQGLPPDVA